MKHERIEYIMQVLVMRYDPVKLACILYFRTLKVIIYMYHRKCMYIGNKSRSRQAQETVRRMVQLRVS